MSSAADLTHVLLEGIGGSVRFLVVGHAFCIRKFVYETNAFRPRGCKKVVGDSE